MKTENVTVTSQKQIADNIFEIKVTGEIVSQMVTSGQFVHLRVGQSIDHILRRPISICDVDLQAKTLSMIYRREGGGTKKLATLTPGQSINLLGPLGNGYSTDVISNGGKALLVGGGVGVPPLYYLSKQLTQLGVEVTHVLGFASSKDVFYKEQFNELGKTYVATVDGTLGTKGFVTDVIQKEALDYDVMYACGPTPMLMALEDQYSNKPLYLSLEERMGCGIGACFACVCHVQGDDTKKEYRKVCSDGPVFKAGEVVLG